MAEDYSVQAKLSLKDNGFSSGIDSAIDKLEKLEDSSGSSSDSMLKMGTSFGVASKVAEAAMSAIKSSVSSAVSRFDTLNQFPKMMQQIGFTSDEANASLEKLGEGINGLPTALNEIAANTQSIALLTGDLESATDTAIALNDAFLASGASSEDASRGLTQYTQMLSANKVDMQSWRTLLETMGTALNDVAAEFGYTGASAKNDLYDALKSGEITFDELNTCIINLDQGLSTANDSFVSFADRAITGSEGLATSMQNIKTAVTKGLTDTLKAIDAGLGESGSMAKSLDSMKSIVSDLFSTFNTGVKAVSSVVGPVVSAVTSNVDAMKSAVKGLVTTLTALKIANTIKGYVSKLGDASKAASEKLSAYKTVVEKYTSKQEARATAEKKAQAAAEAAKKATEAEKEAQQAAMQAEEARLKAKQAAITASKQSENAEAAEEKAVEAKTEAVEADAKALEKKIAAEKAANTATQASVEAEEAERAALVLSNTQISAKEALLGVLSGKYTIAEAGQLAWNAAMSANPIGTVITLVGGLATAISTLASYISFESDEEKKAREEEEAFNEAAEEHIEKADELKKSLDETSQEYDEQAATVNKLAKRVETLYKDTNNETSKKEELTAAVQELNDACSDLNLQYDDEHDMLNMSIDLMKQKVKVIEEGEKAQAMQEDYNEALENESELQKDVETKLAAVNEQKKKVAAAEQEYKAAVASGNTETAVQYQLWQNEQKVLDTLNQSYTESADALAEATATKLQYQQDYEAQISALNAAEKTENELLVENAVWAAQQKQAALDEALASNSATLDQLSEKNQETVSSMNETWQGYVDHATDMFDTLDDTVTVTVDQMIANIEKNQRIISEWGTNMQSLRDRFSQLGLDDAILDQMQDLGPEGAGYVAALVNASDTQLQTLVDDFSNAGTCATTSMYNGMSTAGQENFSKVQNLVTQTKDTLASEFENANFSEVGEDVLDGVIEGLDDDQDLIDEFKKVATESGVVLPNEWQIHSPSKLFEQDGKYAVQGLANGVKGSTSTATNSVSALARQAYNTLTNYGLRSKFRSLGSYAVQGFVNGMNSQRANVIAVANSIASAASSTISNALKIGSPSKLLFKYGAWTSEGFANGILDQQSLVESAAAKVADVAASVFVPSAQSDYIARSEIAFAGGFSSSFDDITEAIEESYSRPIVINNDLAIDGRSFAKATTGYITTEQNRQATVNNRLRGNK